MQEYICRVGSNERSTDWTVKAMVNPIVSAIGIRFPPATTNPVGSVVVQRPMIHLNQTIVSDITPERIPYLLGVSP